MVGYKLTKKQAKALQKLEKKPEKYGVNFHPVEDVNGDWFIFENEHDAIILHFGFEPIEAEYIAPEPPPIDAEDDDKDKTKNK